MSAGHLLWLAAMSIQQLKGKSMNHWILELIGIPRCEGGLIRNYAEAVAMIHKGEDTWGL